MTLVFDFVFSLVAFTVSVFYVVCEYPRAAGFFLCIAVSLWLMRNTDH